MALHKVYYRPVEAAVRWSGLVRHERFILDSLGPRLSLEPGEFPQWPTLRLNIERLHDGIRNGELRCAINGLAVQDHFGIDLPALTIRHVELRSWMSQFYPEERPRFLFGRAARTAFPNFPIDTVNALLLESHMLKEQLALFERRMPDQRARKFSAPGKSHASIPGSSNSPDQTQRSERTYLRIVGGLLELLLGRAPSGRPYSSFGTQESVISAMIAHHGERQGITKRTLEGKFAAAKRTLSEQ